MNGLDYYGRLMRRACARAPRRAEAMADPFDATAPWLTTPPTPQRPIAASPTDVSTLLPPIAQTPVTSPDSIGRESTTRLEPEAPSVLTESPSYTESPRSHAVPPPVLSPAPTYESRRAATRDDAAPAEIRQVIRTAGQSGNEPGGPFAGEALPGEDAPAVAPAARVTDHRQVHPVTRIVPNAPYPGPPIRPRAARASRPAPIDAPAVSIGRIEIDLDAPATAPAAAPQVIVVREDASAARDGGPAAQDLLRGPTHRPFGIGQV